MQEPKSQERWHQVSLRFQGDGLLVDEIENQLEIRPSYIGKKGEHIDGNIRYAKYHTNIWVWSVTQDPTLDFEKQIGGLLDLLEPKKHIVKEILSLPTVSGELFLGFSSANGQGGAYFSAALLARISALELSLNLDLYASL